jgi:hypothetical protein
VDAAPTGEAPSPGDAFVLSENLFRDGKKVGISGVVCTFVRVEHPPSAVECGQVVVRDVSETKSDIALFISDLG